MSYMKDISIKIEREKKENQKGCFNPFCNCNRCTEQRLHNIELDMDLIKKEETKCRNCGNEYIKEITDISMGSRFKDINVDICCSNPERCV